MKKKMEKKHFFLIFCAFFFIIFTLCDATKRKRKFEGDFEFDEEEVNKASATTLPLGQKKRWIHDPSSDLCRPLACKKKEICLLEDANTAVCVSRKELKKNGDIVVPKNDEEMNDDIFYDDDSEEEEEEENGLCRPCPIAKPQFLCGYDNRTYSSLCRLDYHNCIHHTRIKVGCQGFCPCLSNVKKLTKKRQKNDSFYSFVPQDIKYDNKHYKYIKYMTSDLNNPNNNDITVTNEVTDDKSSKCQTQVLMSMGNRLLDWFSVLMTNDRSNKLTKKQLSKNNIDIMTDSYCQTEVKWMFRHLDVDKDRRLSMKELYDLTHDKNEMCLKPFLRQCDIDRNFEITTQEWCACFRRTDRACAAVKHKILTQNVIYQKEGYVADDMLPDCDINGYYKPMQCRGAICWCVDKHGVEFANTRSAHVRPNCDNNEDGHNIKKGENNDDEEDGEGEGEEEGEIIEGSADRPIDY